MPAPRTRELSKREILERAWAVWPTILLFWLFAILATSFVVLFWPRTYGSSAKLFLQKGRESVGLDPTAKATGQTIALQQSGRDAEIKSAIDVLSSRGIIEPAVDELTPEVVLGDVEVGEAKSTAVGEAIKKSLSGVVTWLRSIDPAGDRERAIVEIEKHLDIDAARKSEVITVTYEAETPELAQQVVRTIVDEYRNKHSLLYRTEGSTEFFDNQSERLKAELDEKSAAVRDKKNELGVSSIADHRTILETQLGDIRSEILKAEKELYAARAKARNVGRQLRTRPERLSSAEVTKPNSGADLLRQDFYTLQIELEELKSKFTSSHPLVRAKQSEVKKAGAELKKQVSRRKESTNDINPVHKELKLDFAEIDSQIAGVDAALEKLQTQETEILQRITELNAFEVAIDQLTREVKVAEKKYMTYAENLEEAQVDQAMRGQISSVIVAQPATLQQKPISPSKPLTVIVGGILTLLGTLTIALANIQLDDRITSPESLSKRMDVPVLGVVPHGAQFPAAFNTR